MAQRTASRERRWVVIALDGRHVWLGRNSDPTDLGLAEVTRQLEAQGTTAWLAVAEGDYWAKAPLNVLEVRPLTGSGDWSVAVANFLTARDAAVRGGA